MSVYGVSCIGAALVSTSTALATGTGPFTIRWFNDSAEVWQTATDTEVEVTETPTGSNRWTIVLLDTSVNDPGRQWTITGDQTNPSIALFENRKPDSILSNPTGVVISGTLDIPFYLAKSNEQLGSGCADFGGFAEGDGTENTALVLINLGDVSGDIVLKQLGRLEAGGDSTADIEVTFAGNPIEAVSVDGEFSGLLETVGSSLKSFVSGRYTGDVDLSGDLGRVRRAVGSDHGDIGV